MVAPPYPPHDQTDDRSWASRQTYMGLMIAGTVLPTTILAALLLPGAFEKPAFIITVIVGLAVGIWGTFKIWNGLSGGQDAERLSGAELQRWRMARAKFVGGTCMAFLAIPLGISFAFQLPLISSEISVGEVLASAAISALAVLLGMGAALVALSALRDLYRTEGSTS